MHEFIVAIGQSGGRYYEIIYDVINAMYMCIVMCNAKRRKGSWPFYIVVKSLCGPRQAVVGRKLYLDPSDSAYGLLIFIAYIADTNPDMLDTPPPPPPPDLPPKYEGWVRPIQLFQLNTMATKSGPTGTFWYDHLKPCSVLPLILDKMLNKTPFGTLTVCYQLKHYKTCIRRCGIFLVWRMRVAPSTYM